MMSTQPQALYEFEIDPSVVYQLGEMLISDEVQALLELVKNSYDADASYVNVIVQTDEITGQQSPKFPDAKGYIVIEDDGSGMGGREEIKRGWLTISRSPKREMKHKGQTTAKGRTPLGNKGLGRLGTQRLGRYLELWSKQQEFDTEYYVGIDWEDFKDKPLSQIPAYIDVFKSSRRGTKLLISGLRTPEVWNKSRNSLVNQLSQLISPFETLRPFDVFLEIDGERIGLDKVTQAILDVANLQIKFSFDGKVLLINARYRLAFLRQEGQGADKVREYQNWIAPDKGADFFSFLSSSKIKNLSALTWENEPGWFLSFEYKIALDDLGEVNLVGETGFGANRSYDQKGAVANPGPFDGEIYAFPRRGVDLTDVFSNANEYSRYMDRLAGVRVFRDGFGIRPFGLGGDDWLELGKAWTSGASYYGLRPNNVIGYVRLTASHNSQLEETTSREYFVENAYSLNFYLLMKEVKSKVNDVNEELRREYNKYRKLKAQQDLKITSQETDTLFTQMRDSGARSKDLANRVSTTHQKLDETSQQITKITTDVTSSPLFYTENERNIAPLLEEINQTLIEANSILTEVQEILSRTEKLGSIADVLQPDIENLRDQLEQFLDLAVLGITAEALSHEMKTIADGLEVRTTNFVKKLRSQTIDPQVLAYTELVHSTIAGLRKQLSHLDPSLRYVHEKREKISMAEFFRDMQDFYQERFKRSAISLLVEKPSKDFAILLNRGKLTQVIDNLFLNAEYWLQEDLRKAVIKEAKIVVNIQEPFLDIYDTGQGVSPSVEHQLFQPFVTAKPKGVGRGLGLFISRQLLETSNCQISLLPDKNQFNRRYIFRIDFTGALHDG